MDRVTSCPSNLNPLNHPLIFSVTLHHNLRATSSGREHLLPNHCMMELSHLKHSIRHHPALRSGKTPLCSNNLSLVNRSRLNLSHLKRRIRRPVIHSDKSTPSSNSLNSINQPLISSLIWVRHSPRALSSDKEQHLHLKHSSQRLLHLHRTRR